MEKREAPPVGNTGAQNTYPDALRALVDWVSCTLKIKTVNFTVFEILGIPEALFIRMPTGNYGYKSQIRFGNISIYFDGADNMGVHIEMSGQGCRQFEKISKVGWRSFFDSVLAIGGFSRLDVAIDDFQGYFTVAQIEQYVRRGQVSSFFKSARTIESIAIENGESMGKTVYFGSSTSRVQVRFYDKLNERIRKGMEIEPGIQHWVRTEIQLRNEHAEKMARYIVEDDQNIGRHIRGVLKYYMTFRKRTNDVNKARWPVAEFWEKFTEDVEKLRLSPVAPDRTVVRIKNWIEKQTPRSLAILFRALGEDYYYIQQLIEKGLEQMTEEDEAIINAYLEMQEKADEEIRYWVEKMRKPTDQNDELAPIATGV